MIQIYSPNNTNYSNNGDVVIFPTSCYADSRLRGEWKLELSHPLDDEGRWKYIVENAVVSVPTSLGAGQLYRITYVEKTDTGVDAEAIPVFFDAANEIFLMDTRPTNKNGQEALDIMLSGYSKYSATSDISTRNTAYYVRKNFIEALNNEDEDESFVNRWGGEPIYYNYQLIMNERAGSDRGVYILYGKNIESISETIDVGELATRIVPVSSDGYTLDGDTPWVDSPLIANYPIIFTKAYTYDSIRLSDSSEESEEGSGQNGSAEDGEYPDLPTLRAALLAAAEAEFAHGVDKPKVNLKINMIDLTRTDMYKDYSALETVRLGDTVHCKHSVLGIVTDARIIDIRWDCIRDCINTVEVGEANYDYFSAVNTAINSIPKVPNVFDENGNVMGRYIAGIIDLAKTRLAYQKNNAQRSDVRAILYEDTAETLADGSANPQYGALCIGTAGIQIAHEKDIYGEWIWGTAIDFQSINASHVIAGILTDQTGTNYWNLNTGEFRLSAYAEVSDGITLEDFIRSTSGIESIEYYYGTSNSPSVAPTSWSTTVPSWSQGTYIWYKTTVTRYDETEGGYITDETDPICFTGTAGVSISSVTNYYLATSASSGVTRNTTGWTTTVQNMDSTKPYLWNYEVVSGSDGSTINITDPVIIGRYGADGTNGTNGTDGKGISSITEYYQVSSSNTVAPTTWSTSVQTTDSTNRYLWNYETIHYTDNTSSDSNKRVIGVYGDQGPKGEKGDDGTGITILGSYNTVAELRAAHPTGTLGDAYIVGSDLYVWDGSDWHNVGQIKGESSYTHLAYSTSSDGSQNFSTSWFENATYIGFRIDQTQADSTTYSDYTWSLFKGKGIKSSVEQYYLSTSSSTQTGGSWSTSMPTWTSGHYIWTRLFITWSDDTTSYTTPVLARAINSANENAKAAQDAVDTLDNSLNQEGVFNRLTNNGTAQGIFMQNGQLYINMSYLQTGILSLGGVNNSYGRVYIRDVSGNVIGTIDAGGIDCQLGVFNAINMEDIEGSGATAMITLNSEEMRISAQGGYDETTQTYPDIPVYVDNLYSDVANVDTLGATTAWITNSNATSLFTVDFTVWSDSNRDHWIMSRQTRSGATYGSTIRINDSMIDRLSFKPFGAESGSTWYRPVGSYGTDGNKVQYIASRSSSHTVPNSIGVHGQFGSTSAYSTMSFAPSTSDVRLKENIKDCDISALPFIESIRMRQFDWKRNGVHQECGFIADELEELDPNLSIGGGYEEDGSMNEKSVNDFYLLGYLTKAVQELSQKVKDLEAKLENSPG